MGPIESYAAIGDGRSVALIGNDGAIDWLAWPRCDSDAVLGALIDRRGGSIRVAPKSAFRSVRRYVDGTNILVTTMRTDRGAIEVTDLMPMGDRDLVPEREILRDVRCIDGEVEVALDVRPRPGFGRRRLRVRDGGSLGVRFETSRGLYVARSDVPLRVASDSSASGVITLRAGERIALSFSHCEDGPAVYAALGRRVDDAIVATRRYWTRWTSRATYRGPHAALVLRSALALKLLCYAPSGAILAAPTTSLPEHIGGTSNWDYRFCWLRDASLTVRALLGLGHTAEARAFCSWLLHSTRNTWPRLRVLYDVFGGAPPQERTLDELTGYGESRPVRVGNLADRQLQLDVYGEVIDAAARLARATGELDRETEHVLVGLGREVLRSWRRADHGLWEPRTAPEHHTHSRLLCWVAVDRLLELHRRGLIRRLDVAAFEAARSAIRADIESRAWNAKLESYVGVLDGVELDASSLLLSWYGFEAAASPRMRSTSRVVRAHLETPHGLRRYRPRDGADEGAFVICGFWAVEQLAREGCLEEARALFASLSRAANDVGLLAEEVDTESGALLGNFPQAFSHVGLVNAALTLDEVA